MLKQEEILNSIVELKETCSIHQVPLLQLNKMLGIVGEAKPRKPSPFCPECVKEGVVQKEQELDKQGENQLLYAKTYDVLMRDSTIPNDLREATFENFIVKTKEEEQLLSFAKNQVEKYLQGMTGNTLFTGSTGIGKSHLSISIAKALNEACRLKNEPKSVLFVNLTEILRRIRESFSFNSKEGHYSKILKEVDFLILDDLGVKLNNSNNKGKSIWEEEFIFDILSNRDKTILTTNLSSTEIASLYSDRVASRVRTGLKGNLFKAFSIKDKRYSINQLKAQQGSKGVN